MVLPANIDYGGQGYLLSGTFSIVAQQMVNKASWKSAVRVATTANVTIATALNAGDTIDGVTLATNDRVLVWQQSTQSQNGVYVVDTTPFRSPDFDASDEIVGALVPVTAGSTYGGKTFRNTNTTAVVVDTDPITFAVDSLGSGVDTVGVAPGDTLVFDGTDWISVPSGRHAHVVGEPFVGDGAQTVFYLANEAEPDTVAAYDGNGNRVAITQDATELDKITFTAAPTAAQGWLDYIPATG